ncbi:UNVERIFIED_CONTAM: hypothetical protein GTU68_066867 [Idotea baltica]|nr:hypothetical protein [Idotea baltica]
MIQHVYERATESEATEVIIATDDDRIAQAAHLFGAEVCMTKVEHASGTDRLAEVVSRNHFYDDDIIINVQGDEPCLPAALINQVAQDLILHKNADIATLYSAIDDEKHLFDSNVVKVTVDHAGYALTFSRAPMPPLPRKLPHKRHVGLYGYRASFLKQYAALKPCELEQAESLEQLRALYHGKKIHLTEAKISAGHGVDTEADLAQVRHLLR